MKQTSKTRRGYHGSDPMFAFVPKQTLMALLHVDVIVLDYGCARSDNTCVAHGHLTVHIVGSADVEV